jgi:hypothetical protein
MSGEGERPAAPWVSSSWLDSEREDDDPSCCRVRRHDGVHGSGEAECRGAGGDDGVRGSGEPERHGAGGDDGGRGEDGGRSAGGDDGGRGAGD